MIAKPPQGRGPSQPSKGTKMTIPGPVNSTLSFYQEDFGKTLFPLRTNHELIERGEIEIKEFILRCLDQTQTDFSFLPQRRAYAAKPGLHLRRTFKLDPLVEYYIYDVIFRNRTRFRKPHTAGRAHYGYRFESGATISSSAAYKGFKGALAEYKSKYSCSMSFDVASYFNSIYHHDIVSWFSELGASGDDLSGFNQILREINTGRTVDCLPQGLYPTKMIGNDFLRFIDNSHALRSSQLVRFMDDIYIFSNDMDTIKTDFLLIQRLLGDKGLSVNPQKTKSEATFHFSIDREIDDVKKQLLHRRRVMIAVGSGEDGEDDTKEIMLKHPLDKRELDYIDTLLNRAEIEEEDAELILTIMRNHASKVENRLPYLVETYPHLVKNIHRFCANISDKNFIGKLILDAIRKSSIIMEFQLFWFAVMLEDYLMDTPIASSIISELFQHKSATTITKAKILEIPDVRFGLPELRNEFLKSGQSDWLAWASAVGSRSLTASSRNHMLAYFGKSSQLNRIIAGIVRDKW